LNDYAFLSNFFPTNPAKIEYRHMEFSCVENAYQAAKFEDVHTRVRFVLISPVEAKRLAKKLPRREEWSSVALTVMSDLVRQKFYKNETLKQLLLDTKDREIIEGNYWGDTYWGVCKGVGENHLGKILMKVRAELQGYDYEQSPLRLAHDGPKQ